VQKFDALCCGLVPEQGKPSAGLLFCQSDPDSRTLNGCAGAFSANPSRRRRAQHKFPECNKVIEGCKEIDGLFPASRVR
jgi:hypothetical protein